MRVDEGGRRRRWPAWTHQKSFTQGAREDWYGQVWLSSGMEVVEARMKVVVEGGGDLCFGLRSGSSPVSLPDPH